MKLLGAAAAAGRHLGILGQRVFALGRIHLFVVLAELGLDGFGIQAENLFLPWQSMWENPNFVILATSRLSSSSFLPSSPVEHFSTRPDRCRPCAASSPGCGCWGCGTRCIP